MSGKQTLDALEQAKLDISSIRALVITHEHTDHMKGAGVVSRKLNIPVYATEGTWEGMHRAVGEVPRHHRMIIRADESFFLDDIEAVPFHIPHDANEPTGFRFYIGRHSVAVATDLGHFSKFVLQAIEGADIVLLESNHDPDMLMNNPSYPQRLKTRILGRKGHLSNEAGAEAAVQLLEQRHQAPAAGAPEQGKQHARSGLPDRIRRAGRGWRGNRGGRVAARGRPLPNRTPVPHIGEPMEFYVLDEVVEIEGTGLMLFAAEEDCQTLRGGSRIRDCRGNVHTVDNAACQDGLCSRVHPRRPGRLFPPAVPGRVCGRHPVCDG